MIEAKDRIRLDRSAILAALREAGADIRNEKAFKCPFHDDRTPSAGIHQDDEGVWRFKCHAGSCGFYGDVFDVRQKSTGKTVEAQLIELRDTPANKRTPARTWPNIEAWENSFPHRVRTYKYTNPDTGRVDLLKCRIEPPGEKKTFRQARVDHAGTVHGEAPPHPHPIYNRTRIRAAQDVIVVEGEKCVEALAAAGWVATTTPTGAGPGKASLADWRPLAGKNVYLWPDHDPADEQGLRAGHQFMREIAEKLRELSPPVNLWWINPDLLNLGDKEDAADYLARYPETPADAIGDAIDIAVPIDGTSELRTHIGDILAGKRSNQKFESLPMLTRLCRAMLPGCAMVIVGDPGSTKSLLVIQMLIDLLISSKIPASCYMLEDDRNYHLMRCIAQLAKNSKMTIEEWVHENRAAIDGATTEHKDAIAKLSAAIADAPDSSPNYSDLIEWTESAAAKSRVIIIDPITAIDAGKEPWSAERVFMAKAKAALRKNRASMIIVTHPRGAQTKGGVDDMAGSRAFGRFAQTVVWLKRYDKPQMMWIKNSYGTQEQIMIDRELRLIKVRNAAGQGLRIGLQFNANTLQFTECGAIVEDYES